MQRLLASPTHVPKKGGRRLPYQNILDNAPNTFGTHTPTPWQSNPTPVPPIQRSPTKSPTKRRSRRQESDTINSSEGTKTRVKRPRPARNKENVPKPAPAVVEAPVDDFNALRQMMGGNLLRETNPQDEIDVAMKDTKAIQEKRKAAALLANKVLLPIRYEALSSMFCAMEMMLRAKRCRGREFVLFDELRVCVESSTRHKFGRKELGQIVSVDPAAYDIGVFQPKTDLSTQARKQLQISLHITEPSAMFESFSNGELLERRDRFRERLEGIVRDHHSHFLQSLGAPTSSHSCSSSASSCPSSSSASSSSSSLSWHPSFDVDAVPELPEAELPVTDCFTSATARLFFAPSDPASSPAAPSTDLSPPATIAQALSGLDSQFVQKIYAKDAARLRDVAQGGPQHRLKCDNQVQLLTLATSIRSFLVSARRKGMPLDELAQEMVRIGGAGDKGQEATSAQLRALTEEVPDWCSIEVVAKIPIFRCNLTANFTPIHQKLKEVQRRARELRSQIPDD